MFDCIVVGSGFSGAVIARELAEKAGKRVLVIEKRNHIGGNMHDYYDNAGVLVHRYGPHIFHTYSKRVFEYISKFTNWYNYQHEVLGSIDGKLVPLPFNLNTLYEVFDKQLAERIKGKLLDKYGMGAKIPILELKNSEDSDIKKVADYVYEKIFLNYTIKQWGLKPEEIDFSVTARVPIHISYDNRYFQDDYQGMPLHGYTELFKKLLDHENITVMLNTDATKLLKVDTLKKQLIFNGFVFQGIVVYTGALDELLNYCYGELPYRSLEFKFETYNMDYYQPKGTVNYPNDNQYTRITEFKHMTGQKINGVTTIAKEYPLPYNRKAREGNIPFYPIITDENMSLYLKYRESIKDIKNLYILGRLAEYKYYNMDAIIEKALVLFNAINTKA